METVADLAGLDYQDLGKYDLSREVRDKLGRVVSGDGDGRKGKVGGREEELYFLEGFRQQCV